MNDVMAVRTEVNAYSLEDELRIEVNTRNTKRRDSVYVPLRSRVGQRGKAMKGVETEQNVEDTRERSRHQEDRLLHGELLYTTLDNACAEGDDSSLTKQVS